MEGDEQLPDENGDFRSGREAQWCAAPGPEALMYERYARELRPGVSERRSKEGHRLRLINVAPGRS
jgi:hypothetical protein